MSALLFSASGKAQVQPRTDTHQLLSATALGEPALPKPMLLAANSEMGEPARIVLPSEIHPSLKPISLGWRPFIANGIESKACQQNAVNACTALCNDVGECVFGCEIGGIANIDTCTSSCSGLGSVCSNACYTTANTISTCAALSVASIKVLFGSTAYTISSSSPAILPWQVTGIQVTFSEKVTTGNINSLGGVTATGFGGVGTNTLTWAIAPTSIANVTVTIASSGINGLVGESGYALQDGAVVSQNLKILAGDVNGDGVVNASDLVLANRAIAQQYNILYDMNGDGAVSSADVTAVKARLNTKLPTQP